MIENASMVHEYQIASLAALDNKVIDEWPEALTYLAYPEAKALWAAVIKSKALSLQSKTAKTDDPLLLASLMVKNGYPEATPEFVTDKLLMVGKMFPVENMAPIVGYLKEMYERREGDKYLATLQQQIKNGKIDFVEAERLFSKRRTEIAGVSQEYILNAQDAVAFGRMTAEYRKSMQDNDALPRLPRGLDKLQREIELEMDTLVLIAGPTGGGKTILSEMIAEELMNRGENVLYVLTELTRQQALWRRLVRRFGVSYAKLRVGYWEDRFDEELSMRKGGGKIDYIEAGGVPLDQLLNEGRRRHAHIILDYWDMITMGSLKALQGMKGITMNKGDVIGAGLADAKSYAQHEKRLVLVVQQYGKDESAGPMDSARFKHRSNLFLKIDLEECTTETTVFHPIADSNGERIQMILKPGKINPLGKIVSAKDTFGGSAGNTYPVFMDGARFRFLALDSTSLGTADNPTVLKAGDQISWR